MKKIFIIVLMMSGQILAMQGPQGATYANIPIDVKKIFLGVLIYSGGNLKRSIANIKSYLGAHKEALNLLDQAAMNVLIQELGDRWNTGYKRVALEFTQYILPTEQPSVIRKIKKLVSIWDTTLGADYRAMREALTALDVKKLKPFIDKGLAYESLISANKDELKTLLDAAADQKVIDAKLEKIGKQNELFSAVAAGDLEKIKNLAAQGVNLNARNILSYTPLMIAATSMNPDVVKALLELGARPDEQDSSGETALRRAVNEGHIDNLKLLLAHGADVNIKDNYGMSTLDEVMEGRQELLKTLLRESGAKAPVPIKL